MKKQDLRIGNWYISVKFKIPVTCDLSDLYDLCANADGATDHPPIDEMFEPIPITEKWIFKLGFKQEYEEDEYELNGFKILRIKKQYELFNHDFPVTIKYVHELQNLYYALTKDELAVAP